MPKKKNITIKDIFDQETQIENTDVRKTYIWKEDMWAKFLADMETVSATNEPHFMGPITLEDGAEPQSGEGFTKRKIIVDGLQRLTNYLIFMRVYCLKSGQTSRFDADYRVSGKELALRHGPVDSKIFEKIMAMESAEPVKEVESSAIDDCWNYYVEHIDASKLDYDAIVRNILFEQVNTGVEEGLL